MVLEWVGMVDMACSWNHSIDSTFSAIRFGSGSWSLPICGESVTSSSSGQFSCSLVSGQHNPSIHLRGDWRMLCRHVHPTKVLRSIGAVSGRMLR